MPSTRQKGVSLARDSVGGLREGGRAGGEGGRGGQLPAQADRGFQERGARSRGAGRGRRGGAPLPRPRSPAWRQDVLRLQHSSPSQRRASRHSSTTLGLCPAIFTMYTTLYRFQSTKWPMTTPGRRGAREPRTNTRSSVSYRGSVVPAMILPGRRGSGPLTRSPRRTLLATLAYL